MNSNRYIFRPPTTPKPITTTKKLIPIGLRKVDAPVSTCKLNFLKYETNLI